MKNRIFNLLPILFLSLVFTQDPCTGDMNGDNQKDVIDIVMLIDDILNSIFCP